MAGSRSEYKGPNHTRKSDQKCGDASFPHAVDVGFEAGDKHEHEPTHLCHQHEGAARVTTAEKVKMKDVQSPGPHDNPYHQLTDNRGDSEPGAKRGHELSSGQQN